MPRACSQWLSGVSAEPRTRASVLDASCLQLQFCPQWVCGPGGDPSGLSSSTLIPEIWLSQLSDESHFSVLWEDWPLTGQGSFKAQESFCLSQNLHCANDGACQKQPDVPRVVHLVTHLPLGKGAQAWSGKSIPTPCLGIFSGTQIPLLRKEGSLPSREAQISQRVARTGECRTLRPRKGSLSCSRGTST